MRKPSRLGIAVAFASATFTNIAESAELGGSLTSMQQQHQVAVGNALTFLRTPAQVREYVEKGRLEPLSGNADYALNKVSFPYARAEVRMFVERIAAGYRAATGHALVVTSLTRPEALQPRNAHQLSVHPAGMAVDFRVPDDTASRRWLEATLLSMERDGLVDATRERHPAHYHVAVFPKPYRAYETRRAAVDAVEAAMKATTLAASMASAVPSSAHRQFALPVHPVVGGAVSGFAALGLFAIGGVLARARRRRVS